MALTELWEVSQQTGALGMMTSSPCCPSKTPWWGRTAVPRSWALQTWIEMAKYGIGTNAIVRSSAAPRQHDRRILDCCERGKEQEVHKWSARTGIHWLSQLCNEEGTHLRTEVHNRLLSNTSQPHRSEGGVTPQTLCWVLSEEVLPGSKTHGRKLKNQLGPWHRRVQHRGYEGSFVEVTMPNSERRLIEVVTTHAGVSPEQAVIRGWEYLPEEETPGRRCSARQGDGGKTWGTRGK